MSSSVAPPLAVSDVVELNIESLAHGGNGVARHDGYVVFVRRGLPGDRVMARITRKRRKYAEAIVESVVEPGSTTVSAPCPFHITCGGCAWQALNYDAQLANKYEQVESLISRITGLESVPMKPIVGAKSTFGYRNKMEYSFAENADGQTVLGFHELGRWDSIVGVDPCLIADERGRPARTVVEQWAQRHNIPVFDRKTGNGFLRHLVVRVGRATGEVMVHLVTGPGEISRMAEMLDDLESETPGLVGVLHTQTDRTSEVASGDTPPDVIWGRDWFDEILGGIRLQVGPASFLQTNTDMANVVYDAVAEVAQLRKDDIVWDLYCGLGSISLMMADKVKKVVGVEVVQEAVDWARRNAQLNEITNCTFHAGNVRPLLKLQAPEWDNPSLVVVDPPRSGLVRKVVRRVCERQPERIVYVSCNPSTFAADLNEFKEGGYELVSVQPFDQFPHTPHVELIARLEPIPGWVAPEQP